MSLQDLDASIPIALIGPEAGWLRETLEHVSTYLVFELRTLEEALSLPGCLVSSMLSVISMPSDPSLHLLAQTMELASKSCVIPVLPQLSESAAEFLCQSGFDGVFGWQNGCGTSSPFLLHVRDLALLSVAMPGKVEARKNEDVRHAMGSLPKLRSFTVPEWAYFVGKSESTFRTFWKKHCGIPPLDSMRLWRVYRAALSDKMVARSERTYVERLVRRRPELFGGAVCSSFQVLKGKYSKKTMCSARPLNILGEVS